MTETMSECCSTALLEVLRSVEVLPVSGRSIGGAYSRPPALPVPSSGWCDGLRCPSAVATAMTQHILCKSYINWPHANSQVAAQLDHASPWTSVASCRRAAAPSKPVVLRN